MSEDLTTLLDRAVADGPATRLTTDEILSAGQGRVRRRRGAAMAVAAAGALSAAALWASVGTGFGPLGSTPIEPASVTWEQGDEQTLFSGYSTIDDAGHQRMYNGRLVKATADGPLTLEVSVNGKHVATIPAQEPLPGVYDFAGEGFRAVVWPEPEGVVSSVPVLAQDPGGETGRREKVREDGTTLAYALWTGDVAPVPDSDLVDIYLVGRDRVLTWDETELDTRRLTHEGADVLVWNDPERNLLGYSAAVHGQEWVGLEDPSVALVALPDAATAGWGATGQKDSTVDLTVLPLGSTFTGASGAEAASADPDAPKGAVAEGETGSDDVELGGRPVVLRWATSSGGGQVLTDVQFELGGQGYSYNDYSLDVNSLVTSDGTELTFVAGAPRADGSVGLVASDDGTVVKAVPRAAPSGAVQDVGVVGGSRIVVATGWPASNLVMSTARVQVTDDQGGTRWVDPVDVAAVTDPVGRPMIVMAVDDTSIEKEKVTAVGEELDGETQAWVPKQD